MSRPSGRSGSYTGLIGFNPRRLQGPKRGMSYHATDLSVFAKSSYSSSSIVRRSSQWWGGDVDPFDRANVCSINCVCSVELCHRASYHRTLCRNWKEPRPLGLDTNAPPSCLRIVAVLPVPSAGVAMTIMVRQRHLSNSLG